MQSYWKAYLGCIKVSFFSLFPVEYLLYIHNLFVIEVVEVVFFRYVFPYELVSILYSSLLLWAVYVKFEKRQFTKDIESYIMTDIGNIFLTNVLYRVLTMTTFYNEFRVNMKK